VPPAKKSSAKTRPHRAQPAQNADDGDQFLLNENGTVRLRWRGQNILLWTPLVEEYEEIVVMYQDTRAWYGEEGRSAAEAFSPQAPNAAIWVKVIDLLGDNEDGVKPGGLATWMLAGDALEKLIVHWRVNPLARGESQDLIARLATEMVAQIQSGVTNPSSSPAPPSPESEAT
jgi:hypothetical protein